METEKLLTYKYFSLTEGSIILWSDKLKIEDDIKKQRKRFLLRYSICLLMGITYVRSGFVNKSKYDIFLGTFISVFFFYATYILLKKQSLESTIYYNDINKINIKSSCQFTYNGNNIFNVTIITKDQRIRKIQIEDVKNEISEFRNCLNEYGLKII
jgi:hypothetical protein